MCSNLIEKMPMDLSIEKLKDQALDALSLFEQKTQESDVSQAMIDDAKYILVAYIDDVVLGSDWRYQQEWSSSLLQHSIYFEHLAGERFFELLNKHQNIGQNSIDFLELCYICLQLGFKGKYRHEEPYVLKSIQSDLFAQLSAIKNYSYIEKDNRFIQNYSKCRDIYSMLSYRMMVMGVVSLLFMIYFYYSFRINHIRNMATASITSYVETLSERLSR